MSAARIGRAFFAVLVIALTASVLMARALDRVSELGGSWISIFAVLSGVGVGLALGLPLYLRARRRISKLARAARGLAQGDFDAPLPAPSEDELGELQRAWKRMRLAMEEQMIGLRGEVGRQRSILDGMAEGVALIHDGEIVAANPAFESLVGAVGSVVGRTVLEVARLPELAEVIEALIANDSEVAREIPAHPRTLRVAARPLGGPQQQTVVVLLDMTEARRLERLHRDFVANASHELRTPVAAILGAAETLAAGAANDVTARASFVDILQRHAQRLALLTKDLLDLARLEAGYRPRTELVSFAAVVETVFAPLSAVAAAKRIELVAADASKIEVAAERAALEQVLTNLVDNAIKYTPDGGRITIAAKIVGERVEVSVADTGLGISPEHLPRLFERFYRVDNARSREEGGTGLGLAIVKHLVAANGGEVFVESEVGRGTRFRVLFPRSAHGSQSSHESHKPVA